jgi:hypothetical protein
MRLELKIYPISCCTYLVRFGMDWMGFFLVGYIKSEYISNIHIWTIEIAFVSMFVSVTW